MVTKQTEHLTKVAREEGCLWVLVELKQILHEQVKVGNISEYTKAFVYSKLKSKLFEEGLIRKEGEVW